MLDINYIINIQYFWPKQTNGPTMTYYKSTSNINKEEHLTKNALSNTCPENERY